MANDPPNRKPGPFDLQTVKSLVALMSRHELAEIDLREGDLRIRLRRALPVAAPPPAPALHAPAAAPPPQAVPVAPAPEPDRPARPQQLIKSPTPGTFYTSPNPGAEPFVRVGSRVTPTSVVGVIEAMKIFNEITADCTGVVAEILVENQQPVEFGQPLFRVDLTE